MAKPDIRIALAGVIPALCQRAMLSARQPVNVNFKLTHYHISPGVDDAKIDFFFTDEVASIVDPATGTTLWETDGIPVVR